MDNPPPSSSPEQTETSDVNVDNQVDSDLEKFLEKLRELNGSAGNKALRESLDWTLDEDRYWAAHGRAVDRGLVLKGRGRGGSVSLPSVSEAKDSDVENIDRAEPAHPSTVRISERDLYEPCLKVIRDSWAKLSNYDEHAAAITATKGSAQTGGKWTRPDISLVGIRAFPYLPGRYFEIVTFEIKPPDDVTVEGVFEALSHQQFATRSYVVFHIPDENEALNFADNHPAASRILETARRHGVGVMIAQQIDSWEGWEEIYAAETVSPHPEQANRFIATCFPDEIKDKIIKWHK